jgi:hypothetical protein
MPLALAHIGSIATAASLLLVLGCRGSETPTEAVPGESVSREAIRVQAVETVYARGSAATLDLVNDSTLTVGTNVCPHALDQLVGGDAWGRLPSYDVGCFAVYVVVEPGQRRRLVAPLPTTLQPGTYRTVHHVGIGNTRVAYLRFSDAFQVR